MAEKAKIDLLIEGSQGAKTLGELRENAAALEEALAGAALNSEDFKKLSGELIKTNTEVKNLELGFEALDKEGVAAELGGVAGAIGDITSATILLGGENETLEVMAQNIEKALGVSMALKGGMEGMAAARKLLNNQMQKGTVIGKIAITVQKSFNAVMKANPIGLLITGIGLLIAAFVFLGKNVKAVGDFFTWLGDLAVNALSGILMFFGVTDKAIETQSMKERKAAEEKKKQQEEIGKQNQKRLDDIKELAKAEEEAFNTRNEIFDLDIARMDAEGKNSDALKTAKIEDQLEHEKFVLESINLQIASWTKYYEDLFVLSGKSREDFIATMKGQGIDLVALQGESLELIAAQNRKIFSSETDLISFNREVRMKNAKDTIEENKAIFDSDKELAAAREDFLKRLESAENAFLDSKLDAQTREVNAVRDKFFMLIEEAEKFNEDTLLLEEAQSEAIKEIEDRFAQEKADKEEVASQKKKDDQQAANEVAKQGAQDLFNVAQSLLKKQNQKDLKAAQDKVSRGQKLTNAEIKRLKRQDKIQKAFAVAQIAADTARGVSAAIAAGAALPFPANLGAIASGIAAVLAGAAQASGILGESAEIPSVEVPTADSFSDTEDTAQNVPTINQAAFGSTLLNDQPQQVVVVEAITDGINSVGVIEAQATFD